MARQARGFARGRGRGRNAIESEEVATENEENDSESNEIEEENVLFTTILNTNNEALNASNLTRNILHSPKTCEILRKSFLEVYFVANDSAPAN